MRPSWKILAWVFVAAGVALGVFGVMRLVSGDSEVDRLTDDLTALEDDLTDVEGRLAATQSQGQEISSAAQEVDAALVDLVEKLEAFGEAERGVLDTWQLILSSAPNDAALRTNVETTLQTAIDDAVASLNEAQDALDRAETAVSELDDAIQRAGG